MKHSESADFCLPLATKTRCGYECDIEPARHACRAHAAARWTRRQRGALGLLILTVAVPGMQAAPVSDGNAPATNTTSLALSAAEADRQLTTLENEMNKALDRYRVASDYRKKCAGYRQQDRAIAFFRGLATAKPDNWRARLELACAYIDKIPTCTGITAFVNRGALASKALEQLDIVVAKHPDLWVGHFARGLDHLHWPRVLRHSDDAIQDLKKCVALQEKNGGQGGHPYYLRVHIALGDACAKAGDYQQARDAWQRGLKAFPDSKALKTRLQVKDDDALLKYVESERSLDTPVDTSLAFLDDQT